MLEDVARLTGLFSGRPGGSLSAPGKDRHCPGICREGNI